MTYFKWQYDSIINPAFENFGLYCDKFVSAVLVRGQSQNKMTMKRVRLVLNCGSAAGIKSVLFGRQVRQHFSTNNGDNSKINNLLEVLQQVKQGSLDIHKAEEILSSCAPPTTTKTSNYDETLAKFANVDHNRSQRTGFPEAVFGSGKSPEQVARILDHMALKVNDRNSLNILGGAGTTSPSPPILATRVTPEEYARIAKYPFQNGTTTYYEEARIVSMVASSVASTNFTSGKRSNQQYPKCIVVTAGTTDIPVAEEAATVLELSHAVEVERIYDVGVAGLHRIVSNIPKLTASNVKCVIVCAGMDGALPSVVGGLVSVPVLAVPTSIGYGISLGGVSAMLTMLNSCAPGVGVLNIDNGFGAAALAYKCMTSRL